ncbi:MAG: YkgJ family cysteine cluster protein [Polyangiaceae bacterium]
MTPEQHLEALWSKVDAFFERVAERYPGALACAAGCSDCCRRDLTVTSIEAHRIAALVRALPPEERAALLERVSGAPCVALDADGRCGIYAARPLVCRSHGVPLRFVEPGASGKRALPVLDVCPKNFVGADLASIDAACVLDQATLSAMLGAIDAVFVRSLREGPLGEEDRFTSGRREALRDVIRTAATPPAP